ncbi:4-hydroxy-tetrahydrodipicolinate reductase [Bacteroidales bacterium OttesenSCG-928-B11]|nr:4-hydroxy-tetrahydrodipicolinate reductase [Bacteroidales bacterium OttesenSCG-928-C03]MDL2312193.1 4-hydroxy-tetrahydrodipicolinate reductase [Bacteroidales bacterium OttesenSCG-928-B11]MDL2326239.1 4-hydroxy-tetrahydrodipicolinate reductase [Bacteroidales bacterium OttesenSCG-928-A14]
MKLALVGYGKMGKEIERNLPENCKISVIIDNPEDWENKESLLKTVDVAIEFSTPSAAFDNCKRCVELGIPVVSGTTGWNEQIDKFLQYSFAQSASFIHGSNFSIGANLFFSVNQYFAKLINSQEQYNVSIKETHHTAKLDKPSGTAVTVTNLIIEELERKDGWLLDQNAPGKIPVYALREENVTGIHEVCYSSEEDEITIAHQARNRKGFALGAIKAAQWLLQNPGVYNFKDIFHLI